MSNNFSYPPTLIGTPQEGLSQVPSGSTLYEHQPYPNKGHADSYFPHTTKADAVVFNDTIDDNDLKAQVPRDTKAESKVLRKIDWRIVPICAMLNLFSFVDKLNIGNAKIAGLEQDLHMNPHSVQYNLLIFTFALSQVLSEVPCVVLSKHFGLARSIPFMVVLFGIVSLTFSFVTNFATAIMVRIALGSAEAGLLPALMLYLSRWYQKDEVALRFACCMAMGPLAGIMSGFLASAILKIHDMGPFVVRWRMIFLIESLVTIVVGFLCFPFMPENVDGAKFLSHEEKEIVRRRMAEETASLSKPSTPTDGPVAKAEKASAKRNKRREMWNGFLAPTSLVLGVVQALTIITLASGHFFLPTIVAILFPDATVIQKELLTSPPSFFGLVSLLLSSYLANRLRIRGPLVLGAISVAVTGSLGFLLSTSNPHLRYVSTFAVFFGTVPPTALLATWASINVRTETERLGAIASFSLIGISGTLFSTWLYLPDDAPRYMRASSINLACAVTSFGLVASLMFWLKEENRKRQQGLRDDRLVGKSQEEVDLLGWRDPRFRLRY